LDDTELSYYEAVFKTSKLLKFEYRPLELKLYQYCSIFQSFFLYELLLASNNFKIEICRKHNGLVLSRNN